MKRMRLIITLCFAIVFVLSGCKNVSNEQEKDIVVGVEYLNEDAKTAFVGIELSNITVEKDLEKLIVTSCEKGFLTDGKEVSIDVTEIADINYDSLSVCEKMEAVVLETASGCEVEALVEVKVSALENVETSSETEGAQTLTETCVYCDESGNSNKHEGTCDFPNCMGSHVYSCTTCGGGSNPVTCASCNGNGTCKVCGGGQHHSENNHNENHH